MKYLIITGVIALIFYLLLYLRMRRYFPVVRRIFGITRDLYRMSKTQEAAQPPLANPARQKRGGERLIRCTACGTWVPAGRAVNLRSSSASYCSTECLENAAARPGPARKTAER